MYRSSHPEAALACLVISVETAARCRQGTLSAGFRSRCLLLFALLVAFARPSPVDAATFEWSGGDSNDANWTSNDNWEGLGGAGANDDLVFPGAASRKTNANDFAVNTNFNSLTFRAGSYTITGNQILLANGITADFTQGGGASSSFAPNIILGASQTWSAGLGTLTLGGVVNLSNRSLIVTGGTAGNGFILNGIINGTGTLTKNGNGDLTIASDADSFGSTTLNGGSLIVTGSLGAVTLSGGTLRGTGSVGGITATAGTIDPGVVSPDTAILTSTGAVVLGSGTGFKVDLNGTTPGTQHDQLVVTTSNIDLGNAVLNLNVVTGFTPVIGQQFTIVSQTGVGSISGQFAQGTSVIVFGRLFAIAYSSSSVVLTFQGTSLTWDGGGATDNWGLSTNWDFDVVPEDAVSLVFPAGVPADSLTNNNNISGLSLRSITFTGSGYDITGNAIELGSGIANNVSTGGGIAFAPHLKLLQSQTFLSSALTTVLTGQMDLNGSTVTFDGAGSHVLFGQVIGVAPIGSGGIVKNGTGSLALFSANNTYTGLTLINNGLVRMSDPDSLGATGSGNNSVVAAGATLALEGNVTNVPESVALNGSGIGGTGALRADACNIGCSFTGGVGPQTDSTINVPTAGHTLTLAGPTGGSAAGLTKVGAGTLILNATNTYTGTTTVSQGILLVNGNGATSPVNLTGGTLGGAGTVGGISAANGTVAPGLSAGTLNSAGNVTFGAGTIFSVEIGGLTAGAQYDQLNVTGTANLGAGVASLSVSLINGFTPSIGQQFTIIQSSGALSGTFSQGASINISGTNFAIAYNANSVVLSVVPPATPTPTPAPSATPTPTASSTPSVTASPSATATPARSRLANIATRLRVETGDNVLIGGFIVTGASQKRIIVRAIGPSLPQEVGPLANPLLELYDGNAQLLASNDNWQEAPNAQEIIASTIPPPNELESAILRDVDLGAYTAIVRDVAGGEGVGLVEVYDLGAAQDSKLANISTRGRVLTGDNVMIGGLIITGSSPQRVILRAIGPSLGIAGQLEDPLLEVFDANGSPLVSNNNWKESQQAEIEATTIPPASELESALVASLPPAAYTAVVRGVGDATGVALVEVYALD